MSHAELKIPVFVKHFQTLEERIVVAKLGIN